MARNLLKRAAQFLQSKAEKHMAEVVVYERPGSGTASVLAIVGETTYQQDNQTGVIDRVVRIDYTIRRSSLVIDGQQIEPKRNDIIRQTLEDGSLYVGRVLGEFGVSHVQDSDGYGIALRIHTKRD